MQQVLYHIIYNVRFRESIFTPFGMNVIHDAMNPANRVHSEEVIGVFVRVFYALPEFKCTCIAGVSQQRA